MAEWLVYLFAAAGAWQVRGWLILFIDWLQASEEREYQERKREAKNGGSK